MHGKTMIAVDSADGEGKRIRTYKRRRGCSSVRRICTLCQKACIHPNDRNFESRCCNPCLAQGGTPPCTPVEARSKDRPILSARLSASVLEIEEWKKSLKSVETVQPRGEEER